MTIDAIDFFADPCCPWSWNTSRWLVEVTALLDLDVTWRSMSVAELNREKEVSAHFAPKLECSRRMARTFEALHAAGRNDDYARLFTAYGAHLHLDDRSPDDDLEIASATEAGLDPDEILSFAMDPTWDAGITASVAEAIELAGPDVGSPIIAVPALGRGFMGPIVSPPARGDDAIAVWRMVETAFSVPVLFELKRGRRDPVTFGPGR